MYSIRMIKNIFLIIALLLCSAVRAEYGDILLNNIAEKAGMQPVVFPHWFHRIRFTCKVCHADLGIKLKAGSSQIKMVDIMNGQYCGACHNGIIAWNIESCSLCHSGKPEAKTQVQRSELQKLLDVTNKTGIENDDK